jgi:hypothetical protein
MSGCNFNVAGANTAPSFSRCKVPSRPRTSGFWMVQAGNRFDSVAARHTVLRPANYFKGNPNPPTCGLPVTAVNPKAGLVRAQENSRSENDGFCDFRADAGRTLDSGGGAAANFRMDCLAKEFRTTFTLQRAHSGLLRRLSLDELLFKPPTLQYARGAAGRPSPAPHLLIAAGEFNRAGRGRISGRQPIAAGVLFEHRTHRPTERTILPTIPATRTSNAEAGVALRIADRTWIPALLYGVWPVPCAWPGDSPWRHRSKSGLPAPSEASMHRVITQWLLIAQGKAIPSSCLDS